MQVSIFSEPFDGEYLPSATFEGQHQAGKHWLAVEKNGASAALSQFTAVFRAGMKEILAQYFQQSLIGREGDIGFFAVQRESYLRRFLRCDRQWHLEDNYLAEERFLCSTEALSRVMGTASRSQEFRRNTPGLANNPRIR